MVGAEVAGASQSVRILHFIGLTAHVDQGAVALTAVAADVDGTAGLDRNAQSTAVNLKP